MRKVSSKMLMSGNEAIARGAFEAGVGFCASYPGTPSTEITTELMHITKDLDVYIEWSVNEKVALEAATAASWAGIPALCPMKSLGLNVASDFLLNMNLSGSGPGGLVIVVCDDPQGHSSSNEQDSRFYAKAAQLPLLEPNNHQCAKDVIPYAIDISQRYEIPVIVRSTTRLSHSRGVVDLGPVLKQKPKVGDEFPDKLFNVPRPAHLHQQLIDEKLSKIALEFNGCEFNTRIEKENSVSVIFSSGISSQYARDAISSLEAPFDLVSFVTTHPLPIHKVLPWLDGKQNVLFIEEVDPFLEEEILSLVAELGWEPKTYNGKRDGSVPNIGEMNPDKVMVALRKILELETDNLETDRSKIIKEAKQLLISRPLTFCAGCTHRNVFWAIRKLKKRLKGKLVVAGDIGCYSLGVFYDQAMSTMQAMGSGIGTASGLGQLHKFGFDKKVIAVAGDSTFFHACIPGLINARHKNAELTFLILDNSTTAMTGFQEHPGSREDKTSNTLVSIEKIVRAIEPDLFEIVDGTDINQILDTLTSTVNKAGLKVLLIRSICRLHERNDEPNSKVLADVEKCIGEKCMICVKDFSCPALEWDQSLGKAHVIEFSCIRCGACIDVCPHDAIIREE